MNRQNPYFWESVQAIRAVNYTLAEVLSPQDHERLLTAGSLQALMNGLPLTRFTPLILALDSHVYSPVMRGNGTDHHTAGARARKLFMPIGFASYEENYAPALPPPLPAEAPRTCWFVEINRVYLRLNAQHPGAFHATLRAQLATFNAYALVTLSDHLASLQAVYPPDFFRSFLADLRDIFEHPDFRALLQLNHSAANDLMQILHEAGSPVEDWVVAPESIDDYLPAYQAIAPTITAAQNRLQALWDANRGPGLRAIYSQGTFKPSCAACT